MIFSSKSFLSGYSKTICLWPLLLECEIVDVHTLYTYLRLSVGTSSTHKKTHIFIRH